MINNTTAPAPKILFGVVITGTSQQDAIELYHHLWQHYRNHKANPPEEYYLATITDKTGKVSWGVGLAGAKNAAFMYEPMRNIFMAIQCEMESINPAIQCLWHRCLSEATVMINMTDDVNAMPTTPARFANSLSISQVLPDASRNGAEPPASQPTPPKLAKPPKPTAPKKLAPVKPMPARPKAPATPTTVANEQPPQPIQVQPIQGDGERLPHDATPAIPTAPAMGTQLAEKLIRDGVLLPPGATPPPIRYGKGVALIGTSPPRRPAERG